MRMMGVKMVIAAFGALYLAGCADPIAIDFDGPAEPNSAFNEALRVGYSDLSVRNSSDADDTYHFAAKSKFSAAGRAVTQKRLPGPGVLSTPISPRMRATIRLQIASPSPLPPKRRDAEESAWVNSSNRLRRTS